MLEQDFKSSFESWGCIWIVIQHFNYCYWYTFFTYYKQCLPFKLVKNKQIGLILDLKELTL